MKVSPKIISMIFLAAFYFTAVSPIRAADDWIRVKSKNFELIGNASEKNIDDVAIKLEQFRVVFGKLFSQMKLTSPVPTTVIVFKNDQDFDAYRSSKWAGGYFLSSEDKNYIVLPLGADRDDTYSIIFHEYVHYLVISNFGRNRIAPWFNEGIAEYYDKFQIVDDQTFSVGGISKRHLQTLRSSPLIPFKEFFSTDHATLQNKGNHGASIFYAQSWAFIHYLIHGSNGKRAAQFGKFMTLTLNGEPSDLAFQQAFNTDYSILENELKFYIAKPQLITPTIVRLEEKLTFDGQLEMSRLSSADSKAYMGDLVYRGGDRVRGEMLLNGALALDPDSGLANTALGIMRIHQNRLEEAVEFLEKAVKTKPNDYSVYYYYAYALGKDGAYSSQTAAKIKAAAFKAIELNPNFAPTYDIIVNVSLEQNEDLDAAIRYARKGIALDRDEQSFKLNLANLYIRKKDIANASSIIESVLKSAKKPEILTYAKQLKESISEIETQNAYGYAVPEDDGPPITLKRVDVSGGLTFEEIERLKLEAEIKGINQALRKLSVNEARVLGHLTSIGCEGKIIKYFVTTRRGNLVFRSEGFGSIKFNTYNVDTGDLRLGCDLVKTPFFGVITYKPDAGKTSKTGFLVRIEFVPEYFKFIEN